MTDQQITLDILQQMGDVTGPRDPAGARLDPAGARLDPATLEEARRQRAHDAAQRLANPPPLPESGYTLWAQMVSATIQGDHIEVALVVHGQVQRPEALATSSEQVLHLKVPAEVARR